MSRWYPDHHGIIYYISAHSCHIHGLLASRRAFFGLLTKERKSGRLHAYWNVTVRLRQNTSDGVGSCSSKLRPLYEINLVPRPRLQAWSSCVNMNSSSPVTTVSRGHTPFRNRNLIYSHCASAKAA